MTGICWFLRWPRISPPNSSTPSRFIADGVFLGRAFSFEKRLDFCYHINMPSFLYKITRSKRRKKTTTIRVTRKGTVEIMVPYAVSDRKAREQLKRKEDWIKKKIKELKNKPQRIRKKFIDGESFSFLGSDYPLVLRTDGSRGERYLNFNQQQFTATIPPDWKENKEKLRRLFIDWYKKEGARRAKRDVDPIAKKLGVTYKEINFKNVKTLWGSCTPKKRLNFNWKIALAPYPVFRYIIIHEICHLKIPGHSKKFWKLVESFDPHYKKHRKWIKVNSWKLSI